MRIRPLPPGAGRSRRSGSEIPAGAPMMAESCERASPSSSRPRTVLICHGDSPLNRDGIARWLASFSDLVGIVVIDETSAHLLTRVRRELKRVGLLRFLDVLAFRVYYEAFLRRLAPDLAVARCKRLLAERVFAIPRHGTFVLHPGICPEYRNAHGSFWALANRDVGKVGLTLLKIDKGVDTGPVYGYYSYDFDEIRESHIVIMTRVVLDNLDPLRVKLLEIHAGTTRTIDIAGRSSAVWGHPWLTKYLRWKWIARRRRDASPVARVS